MAWEVILTDKVKKKSKKLPKGILEILRVLVADIELNGPCKG